MKIIYGQRGQPAASWDGDAIFAPAGRQIAFVDEDLIFRMEDGVFIGSISMGVVFNELGEPQGFLKGYSSNAMPLLKPRIASMLPPRLAHMGPDITNEQSIEVPAFLQGRFAKQLGLIA